MMHLCRAAVVCFALFLQSHTLAQNAPALLWSPEKSMSSLPDANVVDGVKSDAFLQDYLAPLMKDAADSSVIFLQNKLHVDDFTKFADVYSLDSDGGAFKNIKSFMDNHFSLELPEVNEPAEAVENLKKGFNGDIHTVKSAAEVKALDITPNKKFLLIVHLDLPTDSGDEEQAIKANDAAMGDICHHLQERGIKYTAMFTGKPAKENTLNVVDTYSGRRLLSDDGSANGTFMNVSNTLYVFLQDVIVQVKTSDQTLNFNFTALPTTADNSTLGNDTDVVRLEFQGAADNGTGEYDVTITINTAVMGDAWVMTNITLSVEGSVPITSNGSLTDVLLDIGEVDPWIPILYSYHCTNMGMYVDSIKNPELAGTYVWLNGFQLQPFLVQGNAFFNAVDCVGFFTAAIWMGIFSGLILLTILIFGTLMVLNLSTPDRFDDPKGKTISVAQAEDS